jgi:hypothetical protein
MIPKVVWMKQMPGSNEKNNEKGARKNVTILRTRVGCRTMSRRTTAEFIFSQGISWPAVIFKPIMSKDRRNLRGAPIPKRYDSTKVARSAIGKSPRVFSGLKMAVQIRLKKLEWRARGTKKEYMYQQLAIGIVSAMVTTAKIS